MQARTLRTVKLGVGSVAAGAAVISVEHVYHFAVRIGESQLSAVLLAVVLEGAIAAAAAVILGWDRAENGTSPFVAWILLALGLGANAVVPYALYSVSAARWPGTSQRPSRQRARSRPHGRRC